MSPTVATQVLEAVQRMEQRQLEMAEMVGRLDERTKGLRLNELAALKQEVQDLKVEYATDKRHHLVRTLAVQALTLVASIAGAHINPI
jgi:hypothetical protein